MTAHDATAVHGDPATLLNDFDEPRPPYVPYRPNPRYLAGQVIGAILLGSGGFLTTLAVWAGYAVVAAVAFTAALFGLFLIAVLLKLEEGK